MLTTTHLGFDPSFDTATQQAKAQAQAQAARNATNTAQTAQIAQFQRLVAGNATFTAVQAANAAQAGVPFPTQFPASQPNLTPAQNVQPTITTFPVAPVATPFFKQPAVIAGAAVVAVAGLGIWLLKR